MFTGIITDLGEIIGSEGDAEGDKLLRVKTGYDVATIDIGASISHNGICLTVVTKGDGWYEVVASAHTQRVTTLGSWQVGDELNLERALKLGDELGGHMVSGHVDGVAVITKCEQEGESVLFTLEAPAELAKYIATKGSVTLDGVSLTVTQAENNIFSLALIPHTLEVTNWGKKQTGDKLNLEIDQIARYLEMLTQSRFCEKQNN